MEKIYILFYEANSIVTRFISWRLESNWVHAAIEIDNNVYSSTFPKTVELPPSNKDVSMPPRTGTIFCLDVTTEEKNLMLSYVQGRVGSRYDILSMLGWLFRIKRLQSKNLTYCFEMVYDSLVEAGLAKPRNKKFISGDQLENVLLKLGANQFSSNAKEIKRRVI